MRKGLYILMLLLLLPVWGCAQEPPATTDGKTNAQTAPVEHVTINKAEKWVFMYAVANRAAVALQARDELDAVADMEASLKSYKPSRGLDLFFYADGTFKIRDWFYGESSGLRQSFYTGVYTKTLDPLKMELVFDIEQRPLAPYFIHALRDNRIDELANPLANCTITVLDASEEENWLKVNIVCHDDEGLTYIMGQAMFAREELFSDNEETDKLLLP